MSSVKSRVKRALSDEQTTSKSEQTESSTEQTGSSTGGVEQRETTSLTGEELTEAVKQGLTEVLDERAEMKQEGEMTSTETSTEESGSSRGPSMMRMMLLGALVAIGILARRQLQNRGSDVLDTEGPDEPGQ